MLAKLNFQEAQLFFKLGDSVKASQELKNTLAILLPDIKDGTISKTTIYAENLFIDVFDLLAELNRNPIQKLRYYDLSFFASDILSESTNEENLIIKASTHKKRSEKCIEILHQLYLKEKDTSYLQRALNYAEQDKVSILKRNNKRRARLKTPSTTDSLLIQENELLKKQKILTHKLLSKPLTRKQIQEQDSLRLRLVETGLQLKALQYKINKKYGTTHNETISLGSSLKQVLFCIFIV